jgi:hypothetical protein
LIAKLSARDLKGARLNVGLQLARLLAVNGAADRVGSAKDLLQLGKIEIKAGETK